MTTAALWTKHRPIAYKAASEYGIPGLDAEDVRQEALLALWVAAREYDADKGAFPPFARTVVHRHLNDLLRRAKRIKRTAITVEFIDEHTQARGDELYALADVVDALPTLTEGERRAVRALLNGTYDSSNRTVENQLYTARRKLRKAAA